MRIVIKRFPIVFLMLMTLTGLLAGGAASQGLPPAQVAVSVVSSGVISPKTEFIGTVYYQEVSQVASEVRGLVEEVSFEEGDRIKKAQVLVRLDSELLEKSIEATLATHGQVLADLEKAKIDLKRAEGLFKEDFIPEQNYDESRFRVKALEMRATSLKAELEGLRVELKKKKTRAPFDGVIITRDVDRGEWLEAGKVVATLAKVDVVDVVVDAPEEVMRSVKKGMTVTVRSAGREVGGTVIAIVPRGDIKTRTFPIKIRIKNSISLMEGMDARVELPRGESKKALIVPRDAVLSKFGLTVVFAVVENKAKMVPVNVIGYSGKKAGVSSAGLRKGMKVVTKGNERLSDGQTVAVTNEKR